MEAVAEASHDTTTPPSVAPVPVERTTVLVGSEAPPIRTEAVEFATSATNEVLDLTDIVRKVVARSRVKYGQITITTPHTTTTLLINEAERGFLNDLRRLLSRTVPSVSYYEHDDYELRYENLEGDDYVNGHAHCRQAITGHMAVTIPIVDGEVLLGRWQSVMFVELDQARPRRAYLHAQGV